MKSCAGHTGQDAVHIYVYWELMLSCMGRFLYKND